MDTTDLLVGALAAVRNGDRAAAARAARQADGSALGRELAEKLNAGTGGCVYDRPETFTAFIRGGGNVTLYQRLSERLARRYEELKPEALLDLGCGDGLALAPALERAGHVPARIDLVEPSAALLEVVTARLAGITTAHSWELTAQDFFAQFAPQRRWQLAQATFSLQSVPPEDRPAVFQALRANADAVVIAEFDVPGYAEGSPEHLRSLVTRYERGIAEYGEDAHLVAQGFLLPVLLGQVTRDGGRTNWELPAGKWAEHLADAGFRNISPTPFADYWWAPAVLITAS